MKLRVYKRKKKICQCIKRVLSIVGVCLFLHLAGIEGGIVNKCLDFRAGIGQAVKTIVMMLITYAGYRLTEYIEHWTSITTNEYRRVKK